MACFPAILQLMLSVHALKLATFVDVTVPERVCQAEAASLWGGSVSVAPGGSRVFFTFFWAR
jgi:hypothetical protein